MKWLRCSFLVLLLTAAGHGANGVPDSGKTAFREERVILEGGIVGIADRPEGHEKVPAVLMLHGFGSKKDEVGGLFKRQAERLANRGIASLRIDFPGCGESPGPMEDAPLSVRAAAAATAYRYLAGLEFVDPARIGVLGFSMGGATAIISASEHPEWYHSMVNWSFAANNLPSMLSLEDRNRLRREGKITLDLGWRKITLGKRFFEDQDVFRGHFLELLPVFKGPFLSIGGSEDPIAAELPLFVDKAGGSLKEGVVIGCKGHIYEVLSDDQSKAKRVLEKTTQWFLRTLKPKIGKSAPGSF